MPHPFRVITGALLASATLALTGVSTTTAATSTSRCTAKTIDAHLWQLQEWWRRTDTGKHVVTRSEFTADADISWTDFDADGDGRWAGAEVDHARKQTDALLTRDSGRPNYLCHDSDPPAGKKPANGSGNPDFIRAVDADADGVVTRDEYDRSTKSRFAGIDTNHDNVIRPLEAYRYGRQETPAQRRLLKQLTKTGVAG